MSITHTLRFSWSGSNGTGSFATTVNLTGNSEDNVDQTLAANSVTLIPLAFVKNNLQSCCIDTDETVTLYTNGVNQVETATIVGTITGSGNATIVVTSAHMTGSPRTVSVPVVNGDTASVVAGKVRTALAADVDVGAAFQITGSGANVILTSYLQVANDGTLNVASDNGTCTGLTTEASSANTTAGSAPTDTLLIAGGSPFFWDATSGVPNPFSADVTKTSWSNTGSTASPLSVRTLSS